MNVVVDAGPLLALGKLGLIQVLHRLYDPVLVPSAVHEEVVLQGIARGYPDAYVVRQAIVRRELKVVPLTDEELLEQVKRLPLGSGEKQAIHLGLVLSPSWVLMDDRLAREEATRLGLHVKGTVGIIAGAYRQGIITLEEVELAFQQIVERPDIWIAATFVQRVWEILKVEQNTPRHNDPDKA